MKTILTSPSAASSRPATRAAGLAVLLSVSALHAQAQPDITGGPAPEPVPAPAAGLPEAPSDVPDPAEVPDNPGPAAPAPGSEAPAPAPSAGAAGDINGPNDPPPLSALFPDKGGEEAPPDMSQNVTINLLKIFVQKGYLSQMEAVGLIRQAENEALAARTAAQAQKAREAEEEDEAMTVSHVPEAVRRQIREEIRNQVMDDLRAGQPEGRIAATTLALPRPDDGRSIFGDIRLRYELVQFPEGNDNTGAFPNFNSINTGAPFDTAGVVFSPQRNVDQERMRYRIRVRAGGEWKLQDGWSAGIRIATGENNSPVSTNQSLGLANQGQGGNFSKYALWLDRAFIGYYTDFGTEGAAETEVLGGRFDSPFMATEAIFDDDLGFDGLALKLKAKMGSRVTPFLTAGAFPIFNTDFNFSSNQPAKFESTDKYLFAAQLGADFKLQEDLKLKLGVAYYNFDSVQGELSEPFLPLSASDAGPTDNTRPSFAQAGNTYKPLRRIIPDVTNNFGTSSQYQYFGLASKFTPVVVSGKLEYSGWEPAQIALFGEYIKNTAFNRQEIGSVAVNNRGPVPESGADEAVDTTAPPRLGLFDGDDTAWVAGVKFGKLALARRGDWMLGANYRWIGSDSVVDGFNDSDFGGGGTNVKGFVFSGAYALSPNAVFGVQWLSSDQIAGPPLRNDTLQVDFKLKF